MNRVERVLKVGIDILSYISVIAVAAMMLLAVADVVMRNIFNAPIVGATELIQMLNVCIVLALGTGSLAGHNVTVDFVLGKLPKVPKLVIEIFVSAVTAALFGVVIWRSVVSALDSLHYKITYSLLGVPEYPFILALALGFFGGVLALVIIVMRNVRSIREALKKKRDGTEETCEEAKQ